MKIKTLRRLTLVGLAAGYYALSKHCKNNCNNIKQDCKEDSKEQKDTFY